MNLIKYHLSVLLLAAAIFYVQGPPFVRQPFDTLPDSRDAVLCTWILAWDYHALFNGAQRIWDAPIFYPAANTLAFSETMFGNLWITAPVQYCFGNPVFAANVLILASFVLTAYCTYLLVRRLTRSRWAGIVAGCLFSFNPWRWSDAAHLQLLAVFWLPIAFLFCHRFLETRRLRDGLLTVFALVAQSYTSVYLGFLLQISLLFYLLCWWVHSRGPERFSWLLEPRLRRCLLVCLAAGAILLVPLALHYACVVRDWNFSRSEAENVTFSCEPLSFLIPNQWFATYRPISSHWHENVHGQFGLGLAPWLLAGAALLFLRRHRQLFSDEQRRCLRCFAWTAALAAVLMLGPYLIICKQRTDIPLPYLLLYHLAPGAKGLRVPTRFVLPLLFCLSVMAGFTVAHFERFARTPIRYQRLAFWLLLIAFIALDYRVTPAKGAPITTKPVPPVYDFLAANGTGAILEVPFRFHEQFDYLWFQIRHWRPIVGGESGNYPPGHYELCRHLSVAPTRKALELVRLSPAQTVVIHLDRVPPSVAEVWRSSDPSVIGFRLANIIGDAIVWEREVEPPQTSPKLIIESVDLAWSRRWLQRRVRLNLSVRPAQEQVGWRHVHSGVTMLKITITDANGSRHIYRRPLALPPYILPGQKVNVPINHISWIDSVASIRIEGEKVETYQRHFDEASRPVD